MNGGGYKIHTGRLSKTEQIVQNRADLSMLEVEDVDPDRQVPKKKPLSFDFPVLAAGKVFCGKPPSLRLDPIGIHRDRITLLLGSLDNVD